MSLFSSEKATSTATTTAEPWKAQKPYIIKGMKDAQTLYKNYNPKYYAGNPVAGFNGDQNKAFQMTRNIAKYGDKNVNAAGAYNRDVLGGKYLNSDPNQDMVYQNIQSHVMPSVNTQFANSGRYGSGLHSDTMARGLTEAYAPYASQQYQQGMARMDQAAQFAPQLANERWKSVNALSAVGGQRQDLAQKENEDAMARWNYYQDLPYQKLNQYMSTIGGNYGNTTTSAQPYYKPSTFSQILGGLGTIAGLGA